MKKPGTFWRRMGFYSKWTVLDHMIPGKWYYGLDLYKEHGFDLGSVHVKLGELEDEGFVEARRTAEKQPYTGAVLARRQYRRTGKRVPFKTQRRMLPQM